MHADRSLPATPIAYFEILVVNLQTPLTPMWIGLVPAPAQSTRLPMIDYGLGPCEEFLFAGTYICFSI